jgi:exopolysaccharide biosynthesis polyprenyl glycosylphosphotransferase
MPEKDVKLLRIYKVLDIGLTCLAFYLAYLVKQNLISPIGGLSPVVNYDRALLLIILIWYPLFSISEMAGLYGRKTDFVMVYRLSKAVFFCVILLALGIFAVKLEHFSRVLVGLFFLLDMALLLLGRAVIYRLLYSERRKTYFQRNILIIGSRQTARELIQTIGRNPDSHIKVVGCIDSGNEEVGKNVHNDIKVIGVLEDLRHILNNQVIDEVLITMPLNEIENSEWYLSYINAFGITTRVIPHWYIRKFMDSRPRFYAMHFDDFLAEPAFILSTSFQKNEELLIKRVFDYTMAIVVLIASALLFPVIAAAIKIFSKGPVIYKQNRCGLYGRRFDVYKFRTMVVDADKMLVDLLSQNEASGAVFKMKNDPRIIPYIGHFLRKTSLDELPQLINVLRGEMSFVGPRPPIPAEVEKYELWQRKRLAMKPGITCTWQITPDRNDISFDDWMDMDLAYIDNWSIWEDFKILYKTIPVVLFGHGR